MAKTLILDAGHSIIKFVLLKSAERKEGSYPHALQRISKAEYDQIVRRSDGNVPDDYVVINGMHYVIGERAERHGTLTKKSGPARYTRDYYGAFMVACLLRAGATTGTYNLFGSHPPGDVAYRDDLIDSARGDWYVECGRRKYNYTIDYANAFDEPQGGYMNIVLSQDGAFYKNADLIQGRTLGIDIGGCTTDLFAVEPQGKIDYSLTQSIPIGLLNVMAQFERSFRENHRNELKDMLVLPPDRVRKAIATNQFVGGGRAIDCTLEVKEATSILINKIQDIYQNFAGGPLAWDNIYLTGHGPVPLYSHLLPVLNHNSIIMAEEEEFMYLANVRGGAKLWRFLVSQGVVEA